MNLQFNARTINPNQGGFVKLPPGEYPFVVTGDETKDGAIYFELTVAQGNQYTGATFRYRLGLWSQQPDEYRIAWEKLSALCHVLGVFDLQDTAQLRGITFYGTIQTNKKDEKYTELAKVKDANGRSPNEIAKAAGTVQGQHTTSAPAPQVQAAVPAKVYNAPTPNPTMPPANVGQPFQASGTPFNPTPTGPQVGWPTQQVAPAPVPQFQGPQAPANAPWGAPPAQNGNPPAWAK